MSIEDLKSYAIKAAKDSGKLEDIERAVSICKLASESQKNTADALTLPNTLRQESLKNWAQLLVPLLSVLTLAVTIILQTMQQRDQARSRDDQNWRTTIDEFKSLQRTSGLGSLMAQVKLKPFLDSPIYGAQANQLARLVLPAVTASDAFEDLFNSVKWNNLNEMAGVSRGLNTTYDEITTRLSKLDEQEKQGLAIHSSNSVSPASRIPPQNLLGPTQREELEHAQPVIAEEERYVCNKIGDDWRSKTLAWGGVPNLEGTWLLNCDLSGVDLSNALLTSAVFQNVNLENANLANITKDDFAGLNTTAWWKASAISASLLRLLMDGFDPGTESEKQMPNSPTREDYVNHVVHLCKVANISCSEASVKFSAAAAHQ